MKRLLLTFATICFAFVPISAQIVLTDCPLTSDLPCGELIYNGGFEHLSIIPGIGVDDLFQTEEVCNWKEGSGSPQLIHRGTVGGIYNIGSQLNDPFAAIATLNDDIFGSGKHTESIVAHLPEPVKNGDKLVLSVELRQRDATNHPEEIYFWLVNSADLDNISNPSTQNIYNISPKKEIDKVFSYQLNTGSFTKFDFCTNSDGNYDCLLILAENLPSPNADNGGFTEIDKVSLINLNAFDEPEDFIVNQCMPNEPLLDDCQDAPSLNYQWSPTTGLSNPTDLYTTVDVNNAQSSYVLKVSHPSIFCETTTRVYTITPFALEDGEDLAWAEANSTSIIFNTNTGTYESTNSTFVVEGDFLVDNDWTLTNCKLKMAEGAKIRVTNGAKLKFDGTSTSFIESCEMGTFWDGIYVSGSSNIEINHAHPFSGSENGITLSTGGGIIADYTDFENNKRSIYASNSGFGTAASFTVSHCSFTSAPWSTGSFQQGNYTLHYPQRAIEMDKYVVSSPTSIINNSFNGTAGNIYINYVDDVEINNNEFEGFYNPYGQSPLGGVKKELAIQVDGLTPAIGQLFITTAEVEINNNYFTNTRKAITSNLNLYLTIHHNKFNKNKVGDILQGQPNSTFYEGNDNYPPERADSSKSLEIEDNELHNIYNGILLYNYTLNIQIKQNEIRGVSGEGSRGILFDDSNNGSQSIPNGFTRTDLNSNTFYNLHKGVELIDVPFVMSNSIHFDVENHEYTIPPSQCLNPPCPPVTVPGFGIKSLGSNNALITSTQIINSQVLDGNPDLDVSGIIIENNSRWYIDCSKMENIPIGLHFIGNNLGHSNSVFTGSRFRDDYIGVALDNYAQIGYINYITKCIWERVVKTDPYGFSFYSMNNSNGNLSYQEVASNYPYYNIGNDGSANCYDLNTQIIPTTSPWIGCSGGGTGYIPRKKSTTQQKSTPKDTTVAPWLKEVKKRRNKLPLNRARYEQQWLTIQYLKDSLLQEDSSMRIYGDSLAALPLGNLIKAQKKRDSTKKIIRMATTDQFERDVFFVVRLNTKLRDGHKIRKENIEKLRELALACPYEKGIAVIKARNLLGQLGEYNFFNVCEFERFNSNSLRKGELEEQEELVRLYPNPTNNILTIEFKEDSEEKTSIKFYDLLGKEIKETQLKPGYLQTISTAGMKDGIYFYQIIRNNKILRQGKQMIQH